MHGFLSVADYDVFRIGRLDGDRRRRGILITSFVSLASLHSFVRTSGRERGLIGDPGKRRIKKNDSKKRSKTQVIPKIRNIKDRLHDFINIDARSDVLRDFQKYSAVLSIGNVYF